MSDEILLERKGRVGSVTLNRPKALNALTQPMVLGLDARLKEWAEDPSVAAVVVRGAARDDGRVPFCAGGDIRLLYGEQDDLDRHFATVFYAQEYRLNTFIFRYPKPYVALIDGVVMGGGVGISFHGSHRVMTERALFAMPETGIGLFPDVGATYFLPRLTGKAGLYLGLTGARIGAADSLYLGLVSSRRGERCAAGAGRDAAGSRLRQRRARGHRPLARKLRRRSRPSAMLATRQAEIDRCFAAGSVEEIVANLEVEGSDWAAETLATLRQKSPTSLKVSFKQLTEYGERVNSRRRWRWNTGSPCTATWASISSRASAPRSSTRTAIRPGARRGSKR